MLAGTCNKNAEGPALQAEPSMSGRGYRVRSASSATWVSIVLLRPPIEVGPEPGHAPPVWDTPTWLTGSASAFCPLTARSICTKVDQVMPLLNTLEVQVRATGAFVSESSRR